MKSEKAEVENRLISQPSSRPESRDLLTLLVDSPRTTDGDFATRSKDEHSAPLRGIKEERIKCGMTVVGLISLLPFALCLLPFTYCLLRSDSKSSVLLLADGTGKRMDWKWLQFKQRYLLKNILAKKW